jgi:hypothetical protein
LEEKMKARVFNPGANVLNFKVDGTYYKVKPQTTVEVPSMSYAEYTNLRFGGFLVTPVAEAPIVAQTEMIDSAGLKAKIAEQEAEKEAEKEAETPEAPIAPEVPVEPTQEETPVDEETPVTPEEVPTEEIEVSDPITEATPAKRVYKKK